MNGKELKRARQELGLTQSDLEAALQVGSKATAGRTVRRWELNENEPVPGPVALAMELLAARVASSLFGAGEPMVDDRIDLADGVAKYIGDGVFVIVQEEQGRTMTVVLTPEDLASMTAAITEKRTSAG